MSQEERLRGKTNPAGQQDNWRVTWANFASDKDKTNLKVKGKDLKNNELLQLLGFKENSNGEMTLSATSNKIDRDRKGKTVRRTTLDGRVLTDDREKETVGEER